MDDVRWCPVVTCLVALVSVLVMARVLLIDMDLLPQDLLVVIVGLAEVVDFAAVTGMFAGLAELTAVFFLPCTHCRSTGVFQPGTHLTVVSSSLKHAFLP